MESVKRYRADHRHVVETEFDDAQFVGVADYDAAIMRIGNMVCAKRQMDEELEITRDDLLIFKSGLSALGEATKKLVVCARTSGGTAGPDQGLMDACAGVESVITLAGVARAIDEFERIQAENLALQQRLTVQDQRVDELEAELGPTFEQIRASNKAVAAQLKQGEGRCKLDVLWKSGGSAVDATITEDQYSQILKILHPELSGVSDAFHAALNPTAEAEPQCLLCLDKKTVPGNIPGGFVKDCPDCCGEEG